MFHIEGTAAVGKSTLIKRLIGDGRRCCLSDINEVSKRRGIADPLSGRGRAAYAVFWAEEASTRLAASRSTPTTYIYDRSPYAALVYGAVVDVMMTIRSEEGAKKDLVTDLKTTRCWDSRGVIIISHDVDNLVEVMKRRDNGLDIMTPDYVRHQNTMWCVAAKVMQWPVVCLAPGATASDVKSEICAIADGTAILYDSPSTSMVDKLATCTDLTCANDIFLPADRAIEVELRERMFNAWGSIKMHTTTSKAPPLIVAPKAVTTLYTGPVFVTVMAVQDTQLRAGDVVCQLFTSNHKLFTSNRNVLARDVAPTNRFEMVYSHDFDEEVSDFGEDDGEEAEVDEDRDNDWDS